MRVILVRRRGSKGVWHLQVTAPDGYPVLYLCRHTMPDALWLEELRPSQPRTGKVCAAGVKALEAGVAQLEHDLGCLRAMNQGVEK